MPPPDEVDRGGGESTVTTVTVTVTVFDCPRDQVAAAVAVIGDHVTGGALPGAWAPGADRVATLFLGVPYANPNAVDGSGYPLVRALLDSAPGGDIHRRREREPHRFRRGVAVRPDTRVARGRDEPGR